MTTSSRWRKSRSSGSGNNACVELDHRIDSAAIRDSKNPSGPVIKTAELRTFLEAVKNGKFSR